MFLLHNDDDIADALYMVYDAAFLCQLYVAADFFFRMILLYTCYVAVATLFSSCTIAFQFFQGGAVALDTFVLHD